MKKYKISSDPHINVREVSQIHQVFVKKTICYWKKAKQILSKHESEENISKLSPKIQIQYGIQLINLTLSFWLCQKLEVTTPSKNK